jgi:hypothetical protein
MQKMIVIVISMLSSFLASQRHSGDSAVDANSIVDGHEGGHS